MIKSIESDALKYYKTFYAPKGLDYINLILNNKDHSNSFVKNRGASTVIFDNQDDALRGKGLYEAVVAKPDAYKELLNTWFKTQLGEENIKPTFIDTINDAQSVLNILNDLDLSNELGKHKTTCADIAENTTLWNEVCTLDNSNIIKKNVDNLIYTNHMCGDVSNTKTILKAMNKDYTAYSSHTALLNNNTLWDECIAYNPTWMGNCMGNNLLLEETAFQNTVKTNSLFANAYLDAYYNDIVSSNVPLNIYNKYKTFAINAVQTSNTHDYYKYTYPYTVGVYSTNPIYQCISNTTWNKEHTKYAYCYVNSSSKLVVVLVDIKTNSYITYTQTQYNANTPKPSNNSSSNTSLTPTCTFLDNGNLAVCLGTSLSTTPETDASRFRIYTFDLNLNIVHVFSLTDTNYVNPYYSSRNSTSYGVGLLPIGNNIYYSSIDKSYLFFLDTDSSYSSLSYTGANIYQRCIYDEKTIYIAYPTYSSSTIYFYLVKINVNLTTHNCTSNTVTIQTIPTSSSSYNTGIFNILAMDTDYIYATMYYVAGKSVSNSTYIHGQGNYVRIPRNVTSATSPKFEVIKQIYAYDASDNPSNINSSFATNAVSLFGTNIQPAFYAYTNLEYVVLPIIIPESANPYYSYDLYICDTKTGDPISESIFNNTKGVYDSTSKYTRLTSIRNLTQTVYNTSSTNSFIYNFDYYSARDRETADYNIISLF